MREARARGAKLRLPEQGIVACATLAAETCAPRPLSSRLDHSRLVEAFDLRLPDWQSGVLRVLDTWAELGAWPGEVDV